MTDVKREHREAAAKAMFPAVHSSSALWRWVEGSHAYVERGCDQRVKSVAQALAEAEQRGRREEQAAVKSWLDDQGELELADGIEHGLHLKGEE